mmetsp:Transcript_21123/g.82004  ORF Transcript_21123/g.82004 Transcript_21123/m.82004 type:complete len:293 (+) Transcript_21123:254-1132(+)
MRSGWRWARPASGRGKGAAVGSGTASWCSTVTRVSNSWLWRSGFIISAANRPASTSRRPSDVNSTRGSAGFRSRRRRARATPSISGMCMSSTARSKASPARTQARAWAGLSVSRGTMPHLAVCSASTRRLVALSSTTSSRRPFKPGWSPKNSRRLASGSSARGAEMVKWKLEPCPGPALSTHMRPPISSASSLLIARPRPVPPYLRVVEASAWLNFWNSRPMASGVRPMPVSRTVKCSRPPSPVCSSPSTATLSTTSPCSVNLTALLSRLSRIWRSRVTSPAIAAGTSPSNR